MVYTMFFSVKISIKIENFDKEDEKD